MSEPTISTFSVTKGGRISDTYACFQQWELDASLDKNLQRFQQSNPILAPTSAWLKEMRRICHVRFGNIEAHKPLIRLAKAGTPQDQWAPILFWRLCMRELLVSDFLETWLYARKMEGLLRVRGEDVKGYLASKSAASSTRTGRPTPSAGWRELFRAMWRTSACWRAKPSRRLCRFICPMGPFYMCCTR